MKNRKCFYHIPKKDFRNWIDSGNSVLPKNNEARYFAFVDYPLPREWERAGINLLRKFKLNSNDKLMTLKFNLSNEDEVYVNNKLSNQKIPLKDYKEGIFNLPNIVIENSISLERVQLYSFF